MLDLTLFTGMNFSLILLKDFNFFATMVTILHLQANHPLIFRCSFSLALMEVGCRVISHFTEAILTPKPHILGKNSELYTHISYMKIFMNKDDV